MWMMDQSRLTHPRSLCTHSVWLSDALALSAGGDFFASCRGESASIQALESLGMTGADWIRLPPAAPSLHAITGTARMATMSGMSGSASLSPLYAGNPPPSESPSYAVKTCDSPIPNFILDPSGSRIVKGVVERGRDPGAASSPDVGGQLHHQRAQRRWPASAAPAGDGVPREERHGRGRQNARALRRVGHVA